MQHRGAARVPRWAANGHGCLPAGTVVFTATTWCQGQILNMRLWFSARACSGFELVSDFSILSGHTKKRPNAPQGPGPVGPGRTWGGAGQCNPAALVPIMRPYLFPLCPTLALVPGSVATGSRTVLLSSLSSLTSFVCARARVRARARVCACVCVCVRACARVHQNHPHTGC